MTNNTLTIGFFASALALFASAADFSFDGRWLDSNGKPRKGESLTCELRFYSAEGAASPAETKAGVALVTDSEGYFALSGAVPASMPDTFWVGVKPDGADEISPRFRVSPVPYAFAACEAELVESKADVVIPGTVSAGRVTASEGVEVDEWALPSGGSVSVSDLPLDKVRVDSLSLSDAAMISLFNSQGAVVSPDYDVGGFDYKVGAEVNAYHGGFLNANLYAKTRTADGDYTCKWDGLAVIAIKARPKKCPRPKLTLKVGSVTIFTDLQFGTDKSFDTVKRCVTVPCRADDHVTVHLTAVGYSDNVDGWWGGDVDDYKGRIDVGVKFVKLGL